MNRLRKILSLVTDKKKDKETLHPPKTYKKSRISYDRSIQNFRLIWLDSDINQIKNHDCVNTIIQLRKIASSVQTFTNVDECINFITDINDDNIFIITSGTLGQIIIPIVHDITQINSFYIFCQNKERHVEWTSEWLKIKGIFTDLTPMYETLKKGTEDCDRNSISISFVKTTDESSNTNLDQLDSSFVCTQVLKEILLTIDFQQEHVQEFFTYCREKLFFDNIKELNNVDQIEEEYHSHPPIWWYTYDSFLHSMLNRALRTMEVDLIIKMGFFLRQLHDHIATLYAAQYGEHHHQTTSFTVYRGQGLSVTEFDQLKKTQGGLISFNNFLSTSENRNIAFAFAQRETRTADVMGVLFTIQIDLSIHSTPFANVLYVSANRREEEILFSMHSVFRIGEIKPIDGSNHRLWEVHLTLPNANDRQVHDLTEHIRKEAFSTEKGWYRWSKLLIRLGEFEKAVQACNIMLDQITEPGEIANIYHMLGMVKCDQGKYQAAIENYEKSIEIKRKMFSSTHLHLASSYNNIGVVYNNICEYSKALSYHEKALKIQQKNLRPDHPDLAQCFDNIGSVYCNMREYSKALSSYQTANEIKQKLLPSKHPNLAISYKNIGAIYENLDQYSNALSFYNDALDILQHSLPVNHPTLLSLRENIGCVTKKLRI